MKTFQQILEFGKTLNRDEQVAHQLKTMNPAKMKKDELEDFISWLGVTKPSASNKKAHVAALKTAQAQLKKLKSFG